MHIHIPVPGNPKSYQEYVEDLRAINHRAMQLLTLLYRKEPKTLVYGNHVLRPEGDPIEFVVTLSLPANGHQIAAYGFHRSGVCTILDFQEIGEIHVTRLIEQQERTLMWTDAVQEVARKIQLVLDLSIKAPELIRQLIEEIVLIAPDAQLPLPLEPRHAHTHPHTRSAPINPLSA